MSGYANYTGTHWLMSINNQGQVEAGSTLYDMNGTKTSLTALARAFHKAAVAAMNDTGVIAGTFDGPRMGSEPVELGSIHFPLPDAFVYDGKHFRDIGPGGVTSVNASGDAAGISIRVSNRLGNYSNGAFVYVAHHRHVLKLPPGASAKAITFAAIDGVGDVILAADHVYFYSHGSRASVQAPVQIAPMQFSSAAGNSAGMLAGVVSNIDNPGFGPPAHVYIVAPSGTTTDLGTIETPLGTAPQINGINSANEVVGFVGDGLDSHSYAVVSHDGTMVDLNTLAPPAETGWTLWSAEGVNDAGQIAAYGADASGTPHFLLLTPVSG